MAIIIVQTLTSWTFVPVDEIWWTEAIRYLPCHEHSLVCEMVYPASYV